MGEPAGAPVRGHVQTGRMHRLRALTRPLCQAGPGVPMCPHIDRRAGSGTLPSAHSARLLRGPRECEGDNGAPPPGHERITRLSTQRGAPTPSPPAPRRPLRRPHCAGKLAPQQRGHPTHKARRAGASPRFPGPTQGRQAPSRWLPTVPGPHGPAQTRVDVRASRAISRAPVRPVRPGGLGDRQPSTSTNWHRAHAQGPLWEAGE